MSLSEWQAITTQSGTAAMNRKGSGALLKADQGAEALLTCTAMLHITFALCVDVDAGGDLQKFCEDECRFFKAAGSFLGAAAALCLL